MNALLKNLLLLALAAGASAARAEAPKAAPAKSALPHSTFTMPASAHDGRDPFFPESTRPYEDMMASKHVPDANAFIVKGISYEHGRAMVIVNNHTFAVGDEGDVMTPNGRMHIRLAEIHGNIVTIEVNGSRRDLSATTK